MFRIIKSIFNIKIVYHSLKLKIKKKVIKNFNPYPNLNDHEFSPSLFISNFVKQHGLYSNTNKKNRNFKDWQSLARSKFLEICKVNENLTATIKNEIKIKETNKFIHKKYILQFDQDRKAPIDILTPLKINPKAVIICLQGANSGSNLNYKQVIMPNDYVKIKNGSDLAYQAVNNECIAICYERIACGYRRELALKTNNVERRNQLIDTAFHLLALNKTLIGETIKEVNSLINFIKKNINGNIPIYLMGYSDGGTISIACAAANESIDGIAIGCCLGNYSETSFKRNATGLNDIPEFLNYFEIEDLISLVAPRKCLILAATNDHIWPYYLAKKIFDKVKDNFQIESNLKLVKVEGNHNYYPKEMWEHLNNMIKVG